MWLLVIAALAVICWFLSNGSNHVKKPKIDTTKDNLLFSVAKSLETQYGGKAYVGLQIPDADGGGKQSIDLVFITNWEAVVISVCNLSGVVCIDRHGHWVYTKRRGSKTYRCNPVAEIKGQGAILESYLRVRDPTLPEGYLSRRVICPNPNFGSFYRKYFPSEVVTYKQWEELKAMDPNHDSSFCGAKKRLPRPLHQNLNSLMATAPTWDSLKLEGDDNLLGKYLEFEGRLGDLQSLKIIRRSKISRVKIIDGTTSTTRKVLYSARDYRNEGASASEWKEVPVRSRTKVVFQPRDSTEEHLFKLSSVSFMSLSA